MSAPSIQIEQAPSVQYLLRLGDTALILGQRLGEWCGHAPVLEEDIALANIALDLIGQSRALLTRAGQLEGQGHDEDQLAFLRDERDYRNATIVELPNGEPFGPRLRVHRAAQRDDGHLVPADVGAAARIERQRACRDRRQGGEGGALPPAALGRLGRAPGRRHEESARRMRAALDTLWRYSAELFHSDASMPRPRPTASVRAGTRCVSRGWPRCARCSTKPSCRCRPTRRFSRPARPACTPSTWATS